MKSFSIKINQINGLISLGILLLLNQSCKKDNINEQLGIPYVKVDKYIYLQSPDGIPLNQVGGWVYLDGGSRGIIIYRRAFDEYVAFDRHCTWEPQKPCGRVSTDTSVTVVLNCACCESRFSLIDGTSIKGPASRSLLPYRAGLSDPATLHIFN